MLKVPACLQQLVYIHLHMHNQYPTSSVVSFAFTSTGLFLCSYTIHNIVDREDTVDRCFYPRRAACGFCAVGVGVVVDLILID